MPMTTSEILDALFEDDSHPLYASLAAWVRNDRRFRAFAETYRGKIRRKLRTNPDADTAADLYFELDVGRWLLQESRFEVAYETFDSRQGGPDYTVAYRVNTRFNVEVRRIRAPETGDERVHKLTDILASKARQMPSAAINLLVLSDGAPPGGDLAAAANALRSLAERKDEAFFTRRGYLSAGDFLKQYRRLSGAAFKAEGGILWQNPLAKHPLPKDLALALERLMA